MSDTKKKQTKEPVTEDVMQAPPATIYEVIMASMSPQQLANMGVKLVSVNNEELFWMTSVGQLYTFNNKQHALEAEFAWLMSEPE